MNALAKMHAGALLKLSTMKTFPVILRSIPVFLGGLNLQLLEVESIALVIHYLAILYSAKTSTKLLLKTIIEY